MSFTVAKLADLEDHNLRGYYEGSGWRTFVRVYAVPAGQDVTMPRPGDFFPGESSGPRVSGRHGISVGPARSGEEIRFSIRATEPIMDASTDTQDFEHGL